MSAVYTLRSPARALPTGELVVVFWTPDGISVGTPQEHRALAQALKKLDGRGEEREIIPVPLPVSRRARTILCVGLGKKLKLDTFRRGIAAAVQYARQSATREVSIVMPAEFRDTRALGIASVEGCELGRYLFAKYQHELARRERTRGLRRVTLIADRAHHRTLADGVRMGKLYAAATILARNLVNEPACHMTPKALVDDARRIVKASKGSVAMEVLDRPACEKRGMGAFLAVAQGSEHPPFFIHLSYTPRGRRAASDTLPTVALIGKGITFDSGGLSLKPADGMETMKIDMAGAASVFAVFAALPALRLPVAVHGFVAACENMPSGSAVRPGDVVRSASGKTIEIRNTDAEGRLTLADALTEAKKIKPDVIIDLATLTGACVVSLGEEVTGLFTNNDDLGQQVEAAAHRAGEAVWRLPLVEEYRDQLKSTVADLKNIGGRRWAGAITAALFLEEFVGTTPWVHLDIAGPSYAEQQVNPVVPVGASGFGVRTLLHYLERLVASEQAQERAA